MADTVTEQRWERLAADAKNVDVSEREQCRWVSQYIGTDPQMIPLGSAPNKASVALLRWANSSKTEFYRNVYSKMMPSKADMDKMDNIGSSDKDIDRLLEKIEEAFGEHA